MTQDEIIKMARQAGLHIATDMNWMPIIGIEYAEAFAKLVAAKAIAELESQEPVKYEHKAYTMPVCPKCRSFFCDHTCKAIAELESQEPVGWIDSKGNMLCVKINESCRPLYTHPPQRTWVGLTDEETERLIHNFGSDPHTLLDEVDARLKARNT
jgi:hypothetical protein